MSAPSSFTDPLGGLAASWPRVLVHSFAVLAIGFTLAGCAAPGASRLERAPKDMPPSLGHLTADVLGFTLYDTQLDASASDLDSAQSLTVNRSRVALRSLGTTAERSTWIGDHAGVAIRQLPSPDEGDDVADTSLTFADVGSRTKLEAWLDEDGWKRSKGDVPSVNGDAPELWLGGQLGEAAAVFPDAIYVADSEAGLVKFLEAADDYAVPERKAMREYAAEAAVKSPAAAVFRFDLIRTQARRPFQDDPATLELARWLTDSAVLIAVRDGWVGAVAPSNPKHDELRFIGNVEWVPDLAPEIDWGKADVAQLDGPGLSSDTGIDDNVVVIDGLGQHLTELVTGITRRNGQYATEQDVPDEDDPFELQPVLDQLDGQATVGWSIGDLKLGELELQVRSEGDGDAADDVARAMCDAGIPGTVAASEDLGTPGTGAASEDLYVTINPVDADKACDGPGELRSKIVLARKAIPAGTLTASQDLTTPLDGSDVDASGNLTPPPVDPTVRSTDAQRAGTPPSAPIIWFRVNPGQVGCGVTGWVAFDGKGEMSFAAVEQRGSVFGRSCDPRELAAFGPTA